jgi:DNA-binding NarL/FixJ family response regulator
LTPADDPDAAQRRALVEIGYRAAGGEVGRALALADRLVASLPPGPRRAEALAQRVYLDLETGEAVLERALAETGGDELLRGQVLDELGWLRGTYRGDLRDGMACCREALSIAARLGDRGLEMLAEVSLAIMEALSGVPDSGRIGRAVAIAEDAGPPPVGGRPSITLGHPRIMLARKQLWDGELVAARDVFERMREEFRRAGTEYQRPYRLYDLALAEYAAGELTAAAEHAREGAEAANDAQNAHAQAWLLYPLALAEGGLGRLADADAAARRLLEWSADRGELPGVARAQSVLGLLALGEGDVQTAASELSAATRLLEQMGIAHPGAHPALADVVEASAASGDVAAAEAALERLETWARAIGSAWPLAAVERSRGHVLLAAQEADAASVALLEAAEHFGALGYRLDAVRAAFARGSALVRAGRRTLAADALADARRSFAAMGAARWEARAVKELERVAPGRAVGELTATERRVAGLVADGRKNREIAKLLFMSVATVEAHLTRIYRKLDLRSRSELTRLVAEGAVRVGSEE